MTFFELLRLLFLSAIIVAALCSPQHYFGNRVNVDEEISGTTKGSQNFARTFLKPSICAKNGVDDDDVRHVAPNPIYRLVKLHGVKVGHVREMNVSKDKAHRVVTRSLRPLLFEIPEFLNRKECDNLIQITQIQHLKNSETVYGRGEGAERTEFEKKMNGRNLTFEKAALCRRMQRQTLHSDKDGKMSLTEFIAFVDYEKHVHPTSEDALPIFRLLDLDFDGFILPEECLSLTKSTYLEFLYQIEELKFDPRYFIRFSESATLPPREPLLITLRDRIARLTGLSRTLIEKSEPVQVIKGRTMIVFGRRGGVG